MARSSLLLLCWLLLAAPARAGSAPIITAGWGGGDTPRYAVVWWDGAADGTRPYLETGDGPQPVEVVAQHRPSAAVILQRPAWPIDGGAVFTLRDAGGAMIAQAELPPLPASLAGAWHSDGLLRVDYAAPERACLMIADTPEGARHLLTCEASPATLRYAGVDVNYQPRAGRWLLLVPAERIFDPPLAAAPVPPGPHTVAAPLVRRGIEGGLGD